MVIKYYYNHKLQTRVIRYNIITVRGQSDFLSVFKHFFDKPKLYEYNTNDKRITITELYGSGTIMYVKINPCLCRTR